MRSVDEQLGRALAAAVRPAPVRVAISEAQGLLCAEEVVAEHALPGFDQAAVDGYAVRSVDLLGASPDSPVSPAVRQPEPDQPRKLIVGRVTPSHSYRPWLDIGRQYRTVQKPCRGHCQDP